MEHLAGLRPTGRRIAGPASDLVELTDNQLKHTAVQFHPQYRAHPGLGTTLQVVMGFLEAPMVTGLMEVGAHDRANAAFVYPTGTVWSVAEVVRMLADRGEVAGPKAGLELCYVAGQILQQAAEVGPAQGLYCHGALSPWRVFLRADGQVRILGYGLPPVDVLAFLEDESAVPPADSLRYCPPERLAGQGAQEDISSDIFALALVAFELMLGEPVYDGLLDDIRQQAARAEGSRKLYRVRDRLPDTVREVLSRALKYDPDARFEDGTSFVYAVHDLLGSPDIEGRSLHELMRMISVLPPKGQPIQGGMTAALAKERLAELADLDDDPPPLPPPPSRAEPEAAVEDGADAPRWGRPVRRSRGAAAADVAPKRLRPPTDAEPRPPTSGAAPERPRRLRKAGTRGGEAPAERPSEVGEDGELRPRRLGARRLRRSGDRAPAEPVAQPAPPVAPEPVDDEHTDPGPLPEPAAPRRRRRSLGSSDDDRVAASVPPSDGGDALDELDDDLADLSSSGGAEALLERLRSGAAQAPLPPAGPAMPAEPPPAPRPPTAPAPAPVRASSAPTKLPMRSVRSVAAPRPAAVADAAVAISGGAAAAAARKGLTYFQVAVGDGPERRAKLRVSECCAEAAYRLSQALCPPPIDLTGRVEAWVRIHQERGPVLGSASVGDLDPEQVVRLVPVENRVVRMEVVVRGAEPPMRFVAPVGQAIPARSLVAHLVRWLGLPGDGWELCVGDAVLAPLQVLADLAPAAGDLVTLRRRT